MITIAEELQEETGAREALLDRALGPGRFLKPSERLRQGRTPADGLALAARCGGTIVGSVRLWHVAVGDGRPALLLGPLAVDPDWQGHGIGSSLMLAAIAGAEALGHPAILLVGDRSYYGRFGFSAETTRLLKMPAPVLRTRFLGLELRADALAGAAGKVVATGRPAIAPLPDEVVLPLVA